MKPSIKRQYTFLLAVVITLIAVFFISYQNRQNTLSSMEAAGGAIRQAEWAYVWGKIESTRAQARDSAKTLAYKIRRDIVESYKTNGRSLAKDIANLDQNNHPIVAIFAKELTNVYLNGVVSDSDDLFIATRKGIASDLSADCSALGRSRSFAEEIKLHFNHKLADNAIKALLLQSPDLIGWQFLVPVKNEYTMSEFTEAGLRDLYMQYGMDSLESFEFLDAAYIDDKRDLIGSPLIDPRGVRHEEVNQFIVVQGFNAKRQIEASPDGGVALTQMRAEYKAVVDDKTWIISLYDIMLVVITVLLIFVYIVGTILIDRVRNECDED